MKKVLISLFAVALLSLSACGTPVSTPVNEPTDDSTKESTQTGTTAEPVVENMNTETSQKETPATKFCVEQGGTVSFETKKQGDFEMELAYCSVEGVKKDAWEYMSEVTTATGETEAQ